MKRLTSIEKTSENLNGPVDVNLPGPSHQEILDQLNLDRVILLNQIDGILSLLPNHTRNLTTHNLFRDADVNPWNLKWALEKPSPPLRPVLWIKIFKCLI